MLLFSLSSLSHQVAVYLYFEGQGLLTLAILDS